MNLLHRLLRPLIKFFVFFLVFLNLFSLSHAETYEAEHISWSGHWWPFSTGGLSTGIGYRGHPSPLEKYELYVNNRLTGPSIDWYERNYYDRDAVDWAGLCPSWARAAAYENYEIVPSSIDNFVFRAGDKKGLLTLCHDDDLYIVGFGQNPEEFHFWLLQYIKDEKRAFTADLSTGEEVWYYPIYRYEMQTNKGTTSQSVTVKIYYADDDVHPDYIGTKEIMEQFTYRLNLNSAGEIIGGEWTGNSIANHPETMKIPVNAKARCPYLDCDEIRRIAQTRDDFLEVAGNAARKIEPGTYHLVLLDSDEYILNGAPGDQFNVEIYKEDGSSKVINAGIYNSSDGREVEQFVLDMSNRSYKGRLVQEESPYKLIFSQSDDYADPNIYTLVIDRIPAYRQYIPYVPNSSEWSGFAVTNAGDQLIEDAILVAYNGDGKPVQTLYGPQNFQVNEKKVFLFDELPYRKHEYSSLKSFAFLSSRDISMTNLFAAPGRGMGGVGCEDAVKSSHLVIPDMFYALMGNGAYMQGAVINETFYDAPVVIRVFSPEGTQVDTIDDVILPGQRIEITPGASPFVKIAGGGWMDIVSTSGIKLSGYQYIRDLAAKKNSIDTLFSLPVFKNKKYVPHIPPPVTWNQWLAQLTVINPNNRTNRLDFHYTRAGEDHGEDVSIELAPYEKQVLDLTAEFGRLPGEAMFRSILEIIGQYPFVGYYSYSSESSTMKDKAGFPLADDLSFKNELILPHVTAKNSQWWTGVGICNPNSFPVDVMAEPYDGNGELIDGLVEYIYLEPGAYDVFNVRTLFGEPATDISFIKFRVEDDGKAVIGGFYLYGIGSVTSLSGANM